MTTRRYTESQIQALAGDPLSAVYSVSSKDRFGDNGIIGVFILKFEREECRIDSFLLSCRVIGRGIEQVMLAFIADQARRRGVQTLLAEFLPTPKNQPAAGFYEKMGLAKATETLFRADVRRASLPYPAYIRLTAAET
jgi:FkbH-like protein